MNILNQLTRIPAHMLRALIMTVLVLFWLTVFWAFGLRLTVSAEGLSAPQAQCFVLDDLAPHTNR